jgi:hypothetical protein
MRVFYTTLVGLSVGLLAYLWVVVQSWGGTPRNTFEWVGVLAGVAIAVPALVVALVKQVGYLRQDHRRRGRRGRANDLAAEREATPRPSERARVAALLELELADDALRLASVERFLKVVDGERVSAAERAVLRVARGRLLALRERALSSVKASFGPVFGGFRDMVDVGGESHHSSLLVNQCEWLVGDLDERLAPD